MFHPPGSPLSPEEFAACLDEAKARAAVMRREAIREFGASLAAAARRLVHAARPTPAPRLPSGAAPSAR